MDDKQHSSSAQSLAARGLLPEKCDWCPRRCGANRAMGERGVCGASDTLRVARAALHFWEEPPISGTAGSGTVFFSYCPLRCGYCQNRHIALGDTGAEITFERLVEIFGELEAQGALNLNMVTPTHYAPIIAEAVRAARGLPGRDGPPPACRGRLSEREKRPAADQGCLDERGGRQRFGLGVDGESPDRENRATRPAAKPLGLPVAWNTSGYETVEAVRALEGVADIFLTDFKYATAKPAARYSHAADYPEVALAALEAMCDVAGEPRFDTYHGEERLVGGVVVRHLLLPGHLADSLAVVRVLHERFQGRVLVSLMNQYTPVIGADDPLARAYPDLLRHPTSEEYEVLLDYADGLGLEDYFWQDGEADSASFIPPFDLTGV